uniref:Predicted methyltransferase n=1 Tax=Candidatus Kentrum sp. FM TaxID=2126340 RepID=A0A450W3V7_9GAMM|nr:MAG: Predicted methyltransferase [Candidatus Kentron sp. FM]VFJ66669.1 MAG: Predicted methyltransferase [Candidatus Kentron sp. FM]VFK11707.1 MAG: Predicted methyltransferase [Candidatus Kentron sp. FM]
MTAKSLWIVFLVGLMCSAHAQENPGAATSDAGYTVTINSKKSLTFLGSLDSFEITEAGTQAGKFLLDYLEGDPKDPALLDLSSKIYDRIIPLENYGGEYTALQWFAWYFQADEKKRKEMLSNRYVKGFFDYMAANDFDELRYYIRNKYHLAEKVQSGDPEKALDRERFLEDFILFNNPRREEWEASSKMLSVLDLEAGDTIVDVGSGPGYFSFQFSDMVGAKGKVYAEDTVKKHLDYIEGLMGQHNIDNIETVHGDIDDIKIPENVADIVFLCSLYHVIYLTSFEDVKDRFIASIKKAMKPDGILFLADNAFVTDEELSYHGPYIARGLIIAQLKYYGFDLVAEHSFIPQRYILIFKQREEG